MRTLDVTLSKLEVPAYVWSRGLLEPDLCFNRVPVALFVDVSSVGCND